MTGIATALVAVWSLSLPEVVSRTERGGCVVEIGLDGGQAKYRLQREGEELVGWSALGLRFSGGVEVGRAAMAVRIESSDLEERFTQHPGKRRDVAVGWRQTLLTLREAGANGIEWKVEVRVNGGGAAIRQKVPSQSGLERFTLAEEVFELRPNPDDAAYALPLPGFTSSYEAYYTKAPVGELPTEGLLGLPFLMRSPQGGWLAFTEANLREYAGAYLKLVGEGPGLRLTLAPRPDRPGVAVDHALPHQTPWRVFLLGGRAGDLLESDVVLALNEPCELADTAWVHPGKTTFPWWNGFAWEGADFEPGLTTETARRYIDFCSRCGIESHSLDGVGDRAWYGGPIVPYEGAKPTAGGPGLDLDAVLRHAHERGVRLRLWMHWEAAREHYKELFPLYQRLGVEGVMLDFIDRDDQLAHRFVREAVELAAKHRLTVTLHGCPKPTGLERTFPNLLSHEAALNLEYNKWEPAGCPPGHQVEVAFTRLLAGPLDFHQGSFRGVTPRDFKPREVSPMVMGGPGRTLASYVVFQNHLPMVADSPPAYEGRPELRPLAQIPSTWEDTRFVAGDPDNFVAIARRRGSDWFLGVMADEREHRVELPLRFLAEGEYEGEVWADSGSPDRTLSPRRLVARAGYPLVLELPPAGGAYVRLTPR